MTPYYQHNNITLYHGDCWPIMDSLWQIWKLGDGSGTILLTDPPYGIKQFIGSTVDSISTMRANAKRLTEWVRFRQFKRAAITPGVSGMWDYPRPDWVLTYVHGSGVGSVCPWGFNHWSPILVYGADPYLLARKGSRPDTFRQTRPPVKVKGSHPYPKSLQTWQWLLARISLNPKEVVFDPFSGSGTSLVAAKALGHPAIGIEIEERYCEETAKRLSQEVMDFGSETPVDTLEDKR